MRRRNLPWPVGLVFVFLLSAICGCTAIQEVSSLENAAHQVHANSEIVHTVDGVKELKLNLGRVTRQLLSETSPPIFFYDVGYENFGDEGPVRQQLLLKVAAAKELEKVDFAGLSRLSTLSFCTKLPNLKVLDISFTDISLEELNVLRGNQNLEELRLSGCDVDPKLVLLLADLPNLRVVALDGIEIEQQQLRILSKCPKLRKVYLRGTRSAVPDSSLPFQVIRKWEGGGIL